jgi:hypothetical protein
MSRTACILNRGMPDPADLATSERRRRATMPERKGFLARAQALAGLDRLPRPPQGRAVMARPLVQTIPREGKKSIA